MDRIDSENLVWKLIAYNNKKQLVTYPVPNAIVGDIIKLLIESEKNEISPSKETANVLCDILGKKIDIETIAKLTGLTHEYLEQLANGILAPAKTKNIMLLSEILDKLK